MVSSCLSGCMSLWSASRGSLGYIFKDFNLGYNPKQVHQTKHCCQYADENGHVWDYITGVSLCNVLMCMAAFIPVLLFQRVHSLGWTKMCLLWSEVLATEDSAGGGMKEAKDTFDINYITVDSLAFVHEQFRTEFWAVILSATESNWLKVNQSVRKSFPPFKCVQTAGFLSMCTKPLRWSHWAFAL